MIEKLRRERGRTRLGAGIAGIAGMWLQGSTAAGGVGVTWVWGGVHQVFLTWEGVPAQNSAPGKGGPGAQVW